VTSPAPAAEPLLSERRSPAHPGRTPVPQRLAASMPTWPLIATKHLDLRKRRGLMITVLVMIIAPTVLILGLRLAFHDPLRAPALVRRVALALGGPGFYVSDWTQDHANFFRSIEITKSMMFVILLMIVAVAAFNIVATLVMIVKEKQTDIAILRTLGAGPPNVLLTFAVQGVLIGLAGTLLGAALGTLLADNLQSLVGALEHLLGTQFLDARVYYMSDLPAYVEGIDVLRVCGIAFVLCALATVYPAWRAARTAPAQALRHE